MPYTTAGNFPVTITDVNISQPKFADAAYPNAFDINVMVKDDVTGIEDHWRGEVSHKSGRGTKSAFTQTQLTIEALETIGWKHGKDLAKLQELVGTRTTVWVANSNCGKYFNIMKLAVSDNVPDALDINKAMAMMNASEQAAQPVSFAPPVAQAPLQQAPMQQAPPLVAQPVVHQQAPALAPQAAPVIPQVVNQVPVNAVPVQQAPPMPIASAAPVAQQIPPMPTAAQAAPMQQAPQ